MKYQTITKEQKAKLTVKDIQTLLAATIKNETSADVEVTIANGLMVYTEDLGKIEAIKALMAQTKELEKEDFYEADDDFPAGTTLTYSL